MTLASQKVLPSDVARAEAFLPKAWLVGFRFSGHPSSGLGSPHLIPGLWTRAPVCGGGLPGTSLSGAGQWPLWCTLQPRSAFLTQWYRQPLRHFGAHPAISQRGTESPGATSLEVAAPLQRNVGVGWVQELLWGAHSWRKLKLASTFAFPACR